jgi:hypothetical protein
MMKLTMFLMFTAVIFLAGAVIVRWLPQIEAELSPIMQDIQYTPCLPRDVLGQSPTPTLEPTRTPEPTPQPTQEATLALEPAPEGERPARLWGWRWCVRFLDLDGNFQYGFIHRFRFDRTLNTWVYGIDDTINGLAYNNIPEHNIANRVPEPPPEPEGPTPAPEPEPDPGPEPTEEGVIISHVHFGGAVPVAESNEYVEIANTGNTAVALEGWQLMDVWDGSPTFTFPVYTIEPDTGLH